MPARSNDFQRLVFLVKKVLAETDVTVTESRFLNRLTGKKRSREVDVCIEAQVGGHQVIVSIECCDHGRRAANVEWVERMKAKHDALPTSALVLASKSGFSESAREAADEAGIQLLTYNAITEQDVENTIGPMLYGMTCELTATKAVGIVPATETLGAERVLLNPDSGCFDEQGTVVGDALQLVMSLLNDPRVSRAVHERRDGIAQILCPGKPRTKAFDR